MGLLLFWSDTEVAPPPGPITGLRFIVEAAFGGLPGDETYTWTTVHDSTDPGNGYMSTATWRRGRPNVLSNIETGTGTVIVKNIDRAWDPQNEASDFYPYVRPMLPIRGSFVLNGQTYFMFLHYADGFPRRRIGPYYEDVAIPTVDGQEGLALARVPPEKATLTVAQSGVNNDVVFTAKQPGPDGNNITVAFFETHFRPLRHQRVVITVTGTNIRVDYIDDGTVQVAEVLTALQADVATMLLVDVDNAVSSDGTGDMHPLDETHLTGGDTSSFPAEEGGERFNRVLDLAAWPASLRDISTGQDTHQPIAFPTGEEGKVLSHLQDITQLCSENGLFFINGAGEVVFRDRVDKLTSSATSQVTFSDVPDVGEFRYVDFTPNETKDLIINDATCARDGGTPQSAYNPDSVATYRRRSRSFSSTLDTDLHVLAAVQSAVVEFGDPMERIESVTIMPDTDMTCWEAVLQLEIGSRITVKEHLPVSAAGESVSLEDGSDLELESSVGLDSEGSGAIIHDADYIIQGLSWRLERTLNNTVVTYSLWPADPISNWFILDDPVRGLLDSGNRLGRGHSLT